MKIVIREFLKRPKVCILLCIETIVSIIEMWLSIEAARLGAEVFNSRGSQVVCWSLIATMGGILLMNIIQKHSRVYIHLMYTELVDDLVNKVIDSEYNLFVEWSCSKVISVTESLWNIAGAMGNVRQVVCNAIRIVFILIAIARIRVELLIPTVIVYLVMGVILQKMQKKWNQIDDAVDKIKMQRNSELDMVVNGFKEVRGFSTQEYHRESLLKQNRECYALFKKRKEYTVCINFIYQFINGFMYAGTTFYMMAVYAAGEVTAATAMLIVGYVASIVNPLEVIIEIADELSYRLARIGTFDELMSYKDKYSTQHEMLTIDEFDSIEFKDVRFMYNTEMSVFDKFNLRIDKGQKVGICGPSGEGKTTLLNLLMHYYEPQYGSVCINNLDYRYIDPKSLRSKIGIINQDSYIFDATIFYNIAYGCPNASEYAVMEAAKKAGIYDFIKKLPEGLQTNVGPKGLKLSGGQKQRIGLARLFLADPDVILLDEATASLDNESEQIVQEALTQLTDKTIVTIAHRLSTIQNSDVIYVVKDHHVVEQGTHDELMSRNGWYAKWHPANKAE